MKSESSLRYENAALRPLCGRPLAFRATLNLIIPRLRLGLRPGEAQGNQVAGRKVIDLPHIRRRSRNASN